MYRAGPFAPIISGLSSGSFTPIHVTIEFTSGVFQKKRMAGHMEVVAAKNSVPR